LSFRKEVSTLRCTFPSKKQLPDGSFITNQKKIMRKCLFRQLF
jgi:hypothetical protein